jgi:hypothetical protein
MVAGQCFHLLGGLRADQAVSAVVLQHRSIAANGAEDSTFGGIGFKKLTSCSVGRRLHIDPRTMAPNHNQGHEEEYAKTSHGETVQKNALHLQASPQNLQPCATAQGKPGQPIGEEPGLDNGGPLQPDHNDGDDKQGEAVKAKGSLPPAEIGSPQQDQGGYDHEEKLAGTIDKEFPHSQWEAGRETAPAEVNDRTHQL